MHGNQRERACRGAPKHRLDRPELKGVYRHCGEKHLHGFLAEFDFRYCNRAANGVKDAARAVRALEGIMGKRLIYSDSLWRAVA